MYILVLLSILQLVGLNSLNFDMLLSTIAQLRSDLLIAPENH